MQALKVLLVLEDDPLLRTVEQRLRALPELEATSLGTPEEALSALRKRGLEGVVSGMRLGEQKGGLNLLRAVRKFDALLPFFFLTTIDSPQVIAQAFQEGAHDYFIADGSDRQIAGIADAIRVNAELAKLLRAQQGGRMRSAFAEKYAGLFEELEEGSLMVSADTGVISYANESLATTLGMGTDELIGKPLEDFLATRGDVPAPTFPEMVVQLEGGAGVLETTFRHNEGNLRTFWTSARLLELSGSRVMLCQCRDITRFEQLEREVIAVRNQLRTIVENSADAIIVARDNGDIEFLGGAAPQLFGVSPDDNSVRTIMDLFAGHEHDVRRMLDHMGNRPRVSGLESSIVSRWGTRIPVSVSITVLPSADGVTRYLFNILDITAQKVGEAEKMLTAELIHIVGSGADPVEALPLLIERVRSTVSINFGMVASLEAERDLLSVIALYSEASAGSLRVGQGIGIECLPAEEELWRREGIIRNNLQGEGLTPLESLLFHEGVRSFVSVPLTDGDHLVGAAHFGSFRNYAVNRGHLTLFRELAGALSGAMLRARSTDAAQRFRLFAKSLSDATPDPLLLCDNEGVVLEANAKALELLGSERELRGSRLITVIRTLLPSVVADAKWLRNSSGSQRPSTGRDGARWMLAVTEVGPRNAPAGYVIRLGRV